MTEYSSSLLSALAAFVVRQSAVVQQEGGIVSGVDRIPGSNVGLTSEDRHVMARISQHLLIRGSTDFGAEVHQLLHQCGQPLGQWLDHQEVVSCGLQHVTLIDPDAAVPSLEARELAKGFQGYLPDEEEILFGAFKAACKKHYGSRSAYAYTAVREWVVRHPIARFQDIQEFLIKAKLVGPMIRTILQFYEAVPLGWSLKEGVPICSDCGNAMSRLPNKQMRCRTPACAETANPVVASYGQGEDLLRVKRSMMVYWVNPGFDEIRLYDSLKTAGHEVDLYPCEDRVDLAIGTTGMDLKAYRSPELLAEHFNNGIGGLAHYTRRIVVVPNRLLIAVPDYLRRLKQALQGAAAALECRSVKDIEREFRHA